MAEPAPVPAARPETAPAPSTGPDADIVSLRSRKHRWRFHRVGGLDQVALETAEDLRQLANLDQKLWVALSCPVRGLELDARTLELLDLDRDGRVRAPEVLDAIRWCEPRLRDLGVLLRRGEPLELDELEPSTPEGRALLAAARRILGAAGKPGADRLEAADVADTSKVFLGTLFNGDGIVPAAAAEDPETRRALEDAIACLGGEKDRGGAPGLSRPALERFFGELAAHAAWWKDGEATAGALPFGESTPGALAALRAVRAKIDDWFVRCGLAALDGRAAATLGRSEADWTALASRDLAAAAADVAAFPLARVAPGRALPLDELNPAWAAPMAAFRAALVAPLLGDVRELSRESWERLLAALAPAEAWWSRQAGAAVAKLGRVRVEALLASGARAALEELLTRDLAAEGEARGVDEAVRLVHYRRDLGVLLESFVNFSDFYDPHRRAIFQAGTLYVDGRSCDLCVRVDDAAAHASLATTGRMFVAYCACKRAGAAMTIAACVTQGDADFLTIGRNGVFYDRQGRDWDATVVRVLENPISIRQAFFAPYKKFLRLVEDGAARFAASKEKEADARVASTAGQVTAAATSGQAAAPPPADIGRTVGVVAALGVGVGALGTLLGGFVSGFMSLEPWWAKAAAVAGMVLLVSGPSMMVAWLKLRQRTLGPILDATGWAVNGRVSVNIPLGTSLTATAALPGGASRTLADPFDDVAARRTRRLAWAAALAVAAALGAARFLHAWPFRPHP